MVDPAVIARYEELLMESLHTMPVEGILFWARVALKGD